VLLDRAPADIPCAPLQRSLQDYRGGARKNEMMSIVATPLQDQDIADLAAYFAAIPVTLGEPPK
jgi:cytochrome c553